MLRRIAGAASRAYQALARTTPPATPSGHHVNAALQLQLALTYRSLAKSDGPWPGLGDVGFKAFSQGDEDGILLYMFSVLGTANKKSVEICAGNGIECNTANLIINHGWSGLLVDGNESRIREGREFYRQHPDTWIYPPTLVHAWVTRGNVNEILRGHGFEGDIDLLSIDMDGVDYWIWEAIELVTPRVVVVEYQDIIGPERALTVPYRDDFDAYRYPTSGGMPNFCGASLPAFQKLAKRRGYRLVGCNRYGYNAFFVKDPYGSKELPEVPITECFKHPKVSRGMRERFPTVAHLPWVEV